MIKNTHMELEPFKPQTYQIIQAPISSQTNEDIGHIPIFPPQCSQIWAFRLCSQTHIVQAELYQDETVQFRFSAADEGISINKFLSKLDLTNPNNQEMHRVLQQYAHFLPNQYMTLKSLTRTAISSLHVPVVEYCYIVSDDGCCKKLQSVTYNRHMVALTGLSAAVLVEGGVALQRCPDPFLADNTVSDWCERITRLIEGKPYNPILKIKSYSDEVIQCLANIEYSVDGTPEMYHLYERLLLPQLESNSQNINENSQHFLEQVLKPAFQKKSIEYQEFMFQHQVELPQQDSINSESPPEVCTYRILNE